jgi:uncharacterized YccA/Bax inhibitor family protein
MVCVTMGQNDIRARPEPSGAQETTMDTATKKAFQRINKEYATGNTRTTARAGGSTAAPVRPSGPATSDPAPFGGGSYGTPGDTRAYPAPTGSPVTTGYPAPTGGRWAGDGDGGGRGGGNWGGGFGQGGGTAPVTDTRPFSAARAYDKLVVLAIIALVTGIFGYIAMPIGLAFVCMVAAFGLVLVSWFRMRWARVIAPAYAVLEGLALGAISAEYSTLGHGIVPTAIVFTAGVFVAALVLYRTGLVRVTPRMVSLAMMGGFGLMAVALLSLLGLSLPGVNDLGTFGLLFGVFALAVAVLNLFTDFEFVNRSEQLGVSADAEWSAAFAMMTALVLVYISILRILAAVYGGRRS